VGVRVRLGPPLVPPELRYAVDAGLYDRVPDRLPEEAGLIGVLGGGGGGGGVIHIGLGADLALVVGVV
jgi:hypothetical protein